MDEEREVWLWDDLGMIYSSAPETARLAPTTGVPTSAGFSALTPFRLRCPRTLAASHRRQRPSSTYAAREWAEASGWTEGEEAGGGRKPCRKRSRTDTAAKNRNTITFPSAALTRCSESYLLLHWLRIWDSTRDQMNIWGQFWTCSAEVFFIIAGRARLILATDLGDWCTSLSSIIHKLYKRKDFLASYSVGGVTITP